MSEVMGKRELREAIDRNQIEAFVSDKQSPIVSHIIDIP